MLARFAEIVVILNVAVGGFAVLTRRWRSARRSRNVEHVRQLEAENREIDAALKRIRGER